jgi:hypothetical protein
MVTLEVTSVKLASLLFVARIVRICLSEIVSETEGASVQAGTISGTIYGVPTTCAIAICQQAKRRQAVQIIVLKCFKIFIFL